MQPCLEEAGDEDGGHAPRVQLADVGHQDGPAHGKGTEVVLGARFLDNSNAHSSGLQLGGTQRGDTLLQCVVRRAAAAPRQPAVRAGVSTRAVRTAAAATHLTPPRYPVTFG